MHAQPQSQATPWNLAAVSCLGDHINLLLLVRCSENLRPLEKKNRRLHVVGTMALGKLNVLSVHRSVSVGRSVHYLVQKSSWFQQCVLGEAIAISSVFIILTFTAIKGKEKHVCQLNYALTVLGIISDNREA